MFLYSTGEKSTSLKGHTNEISNFKVDNAN